MENGRDGAALDACHARDRGCRSPDADCNLHRPKTGSEITRLSSSRGLDGQALGTYSNLGTDLILFATVVVVPPLDPVMAHQIRKHSAARFDAMFTPAVVEMVTDIAQQTYRDRGLASLSAISN